MASTTTPTGMLDSISASTSVWVGLDITVSDRGCMGASQSYYTIKHLVKRE